MLSKFLLGATYRHLLLIFFSEELAELWCGLSEDRESVLKAYRQQLSVELDKLEKDVRKTISSEGEVTSFLRKKIQDLAKSRQLQQSQ